MTELPDSSQAEKWITPDTFRYRGKVYKILLNGKVVEINVE